MSGYDDLLCQVLPRQRLLIIYFLLVNCNIMLIYSSAGVGSQVHRPSIEGKLHKFRCLSESIEFGKKMASYMVQRILSTSVTSSAFLLATIAMPIQCICMPIVLSICA